MNDYPKKCEFTFVPLKSGGPQELWLEVRQEVNRQGERQGVVGQTKNIIQTLMDFNNPKH